MSDLAAEKKRAEVDSDEACQRLWAAFEVYRDGDLMFNTLDAAFLDFQLAHNTERGLRHEK